MSLIDEVTRIIKAREMQFGQIPRVIVMETRYYEALKSLEKPQSDFLKPFDSLGSVRVEHYDTIEECKARAAVLAEEKTPVMLCTSEPPECGDILEQQE